MKKQNKHSFLYRNSLSVVMLSFLLLFITGQFITGLKVYNEERTDNGFPEVSAKKYLSSGHFIEATFENWESEFFQMAFYVYLTIFLRQQGSSESKDLDKKEEVDREPRNHPDAPWPVKKGGLVLKIYNNSLTLAFILLFLVSFIFHLTGSHSYYNEIQMQEGKPPVEIKSYMFSSDFWFESFQNWQSEFLSVAAIVLLSVWLRQKGSPESKPVDTPYYENA